jgi:hypothetical protein
MIAPRCKKEPKMMNAIRNGKVNSEIAQHAQACRDCSDILLVSAFLRRFQLSDWVLLWQAYGEGPKVEAASAVTAQEISLAAHVSHARRKLAQVIRAMDREIPL